MISDSIKDVFDKISKDKYVIGYDINPEFAQISYCRIDERTPETLSTITGAEEFNIPLVILRRRSTKAWVFGNEALEAEKDRDGGLIKNLYERALADENINVDGEIYRAEDLLLLFIKKSLGLLSVMTTPEKVMGICIATPKLDERLVNIFRKVPKLIQVPNDKLEMMDYEESFFYYMVGQESDLSKYNVLLCDSSLGYLNIYSLEKNTFAKPNFVSVFADEHRDYKFEEVSESVYELRDSKFQEIVSGFMENKIYSSVFLIGDGLAGDWLKNSLKFLCKNRRVFKGNNLFSKGACIAALEKVVPSNFEEDVVYMGKGKLKIGIGLKVNTAGKDEVINVVPAGLNWYDVHGQAEVIIKDTNVINIYIERPNGKPGAVAEFKLKDFPIRNGRISRILMDVTMTNEKIVHFKAQDLGFGEIFPSTGMIFEEDLEV